MGSDRSDAGERATSPSMLFPGDGEMARLCRAHDWTRTPLGAPEQWPASLQTAVGTMLSVQFPMLLLWGPEHVMLYNDAYRMLMGAKHPGGLGRPNIDVWPEFWPTNGPLFTRVLAGETLTMSDACYPLDRDGQGVREAYFTLSWSPLPHEGRPHGVLVIAIETTDQVHGRALQAERDAVLQAERDARAQTEGLLRFTEALSVAVSEEDVAEAVLRESLPAVGAEAGAVLRWAPDDADSLEIIRSRGLVGPEFAEWQRFPRTLPSPITDAIRAVDVVAVESEAEVATRYPSLLPLAQVTGCGAWLAVPFVEHVQEESGAIRILGGFGIAFRGSHHCSPEERAFLLAMGRQAAQALARARAYREATVARVSAEAARIRAERLRDVVGALSGAPDVPAVYDVLVHEARDALGAHAGAVALFDAEAQELRFTRWFGYPDGVMNTWMRVPLEYASPLTDAVRQRRSLWVASPEALAARWPHFVEASQAVPSMAWAVLPLVIEDRPIGALALSFPELRAADHSLETFAQALIGHCAQALERARLYDAERAARAEAERASIAKSQFLSTLSHELRNPLHTIGSCAELLAARGPLLEGQQTDLQRVLRANRHMANLVDTILDFARLDAGQLHYDLRPHKLGPMLREIDELLKPMAETRGVVLTTWPPEQPVTVVVDREKLRRVLLNLVSNALKFTDAGGTVDVITRAGDGAVTITVRDTGCGIAPEWQERVFEPFVQVDRTRVAEALQGVGLGLTISRDLVRGMGGTLTVASIAGAGSTFTVTVPHA